MDGTTIDYALDPNLQSSMWQGSCQAHGCPGRPTPARFPLFAGEQVFAIRKFSAGSHRAQLFGNVANIFGCGADWSRLEVTVIGA